MGFIPQPNQAIKKDSNSANPSSAKLEIIRTLDSRLRGNDSHLSHNRHTREGGYPES